MCYFKKKCLVKLNLPLFLIQHIIEESEETPEKESRHSADGDSETEPGNDVKGERKFSSTMIISVDNKGRLTSVASSQQVPSPTVKEGRFAKC